MCQLTRHFPMKIFGDTGGSSRPGSSRRIFGTRQIPRRKRETEGTTEDEGRDRGCWERGASNLLQAILPTTRRGSRGMGKARVSRPRNVFYSDRRWGSRATATPLTYSPSGRPLDLNKSMAECPGLYSPFTVSRSRYRIYAALANGNPCYTLE